MAFPIQTQNFRRSLGSQITIFSEQSVGRETREGKTDNRRELVLLGWFFRGALVQSSWILAIRSHVLVYGKSEEELNEERWKKTLSSTLTAVFQTKKWCRCEKKVVKLEIHLHCVRSCQWFFRFTTTGFGLFSSLLHCGVVSKGGSKVYYSVSVFVSRFSAAAATYCRLAKPSSSQLILWSFV